MENITSATSMFLENLQAFGKFVALNISYFVKNVLFTAFYPLFWLNFVGKLYFIVKHLVGWVKTVLIFY